MGERTFATTGSKLEEEKKIREDERRRWSEAFVKLGDGRSNKSAGQPERRVYRRVAVMLYENREP